MQQALGGLQLGYTAPHETLQTVTDSLDKDPLSQRLLRAPHLVGAGHPTRLAWLGAARRFR